MAHTNIGYFPENLFGIVSVSIIDALVHCKHKNVVHRDIKPWNILVREPVLRSMCNRSIEFFFFYSFTICHRILWRVICSEREMFCLDFFLQFPNLNRLQFPKEISIFKLSDEFKRFEEYVENGEYEKVTFNAENFKDLITVGYSNSVGTRYRFRSNSISIEPTNMLLAVKMLPISRKRLFREIKIEEVKRKNLLKEVNIFFTLQGHINIVNFYVVCLYRNQLMICMKMMDMSLDDFIEFIQLIYFQIPNEFFRVMPREILNGFVHCHNLRIIHRDIKPQNILLDWNCNVKLCDFGGSRIFKSNAASSVGTIAYLPPEWFVIEKYDVKCDIWSFGITLLILLWGKLSYKFSLFWPPERFKNVERYDTRCSRPSNRFQELQTVNKISYDATRIKYSNVKILSYNCLKDCGCDNKKENLIKILSHLNSTSSTSSIRLQLTTELIKQASTLYKHEPCYRSACKMFSDSNFLYIIGGSNPNISTTSLLDAWKFNLLTLQWTQMQLTGDIPSPLIDFAGKIAYGQHILTGFIFGGAEDYEGCKLSNKLYFFEIEKSFIHFTLIKTNSSIVPSERSGCSLSIPEPKKLVVIGGMDILDYNLDIFNGHVNNNTVNWEKAQISGWMPKGRYTHKTILVDGKHVLFGGGNDVWSASFDKLTTYDPIAKKYIEIKTNPFQTIQNEEDGTEKIVLEFPKNRKYHNVVQFENEVYVIGGATETNDQYKEPNLKTLDDIWKLDLNTMQWTKMSSKLAVGVFLHAATVSPQGCIYVFGGCIDTESMYPTNILQRFWIRPPPLRYIAMRKLIAAQKTYDNVAQHNEFYFSNPIKIMRMLSELAV